MASRRNACRRRTWCSTRPRARCTQAGLPVALSTREFDLLQALMLNAGRVLSREQLEQHLYSWGQEVESNAVEVHVHHLRRKLGPRPDPDGARRRLHAAARHRRADDSRLPRSLQGGCCCWCWAWWPRSGWRTAALTWLDVRHELDELLDGHLAQAAALLVVQQARRDRGRRQRASTRRRCTAMRRRWPSRCSTKAGWCCARPTRRRRRWLRAGPALQQTGLPDGAHRRHRLARVRRPRRRARRAGLRRRAADARATSILWAVLRSTL